MTSSTVNFTKRLKSLQKKVEGLRGKVTAKSIAGDLTQLADKYKKDVETATPRSDDAPSPKDDPRLRNRNAPPSGALATSWYVQRLVDTGRVRLGRVQGVGAVNGKVEGVAVVNRDPRLKKTRKTQGGKTTDLIDYLRFGIRSFDVLADGMYFHVVGRTSGEVEGIYAKNRVLHHAKVEGKDFLKKPNERVRKDLRNYRDRLGRTIQRLVK